MSTLLGLALIMSSLEKIYCQQKHALRNISNKGKYERRGELF